jgi:hypothetical protein
MRSFNDFINGMIWEHNKSGLEYKKYLAEMELIESKKSSNNINAGQLRLKNEFIVKLDEVLKYMNKNRTLNCFKEKDIIDNCFEGKKDIEFTDVTNQLRDDGYIFIHWDAGDKYHYNITYRGRFFIENNGYFALEQANIRNIRLANWKIAANIANAIIIILLTFWLTSVESCNRIRQKDIDKLQDKILKLENKSLEQTHLPQTQPKR